MYLCEVIPPPLPPSWASPNRVPTKDGSSTHVQGPKRSNVAPSSGRMKIHDDEEGEGEVMAGGAREGEGGVGGGCLDGG